MATPFLSEIKIVSFGFAPKGWAFANGQLLPINQNQALFSLMGTTYGGNGTQTFQLPNLQGSVPIHMGSGFTQGQRGGEANHTLLTAELPSHTHAASCSTNAGNQASPANFLWAADGDGNLPYSTTAGAAMAPGAISLAGSGQPHNNTAPTLVLSYIIALVGIFPSQN